MKIAFVMFARNKAPFIEMALRGALSQTYSPMDIVLSDQGSTDGTRQIIAEVARTYNGPNRIVVMDCPETQHHGMYGLLAHVNWLHSQLDYDWWVTTSADDVSYPERTTRTVDMIEEFDGKLAYLSTERHSATADEIRRSEAHGVNKYPRESKWITPIEHLKELVGGSTSQAWRQDLFERWGPLAPHALLDVYLPFCAALEASWYHLAEALHCYVQWPDDNNTGLEGALREAKTDVEKAKIEELTAYQLAANEVLMTQVAEAHFKDAIDRGEECDDLRYLYAVLLNRVTGWVEKRTILTRAGVAPMAMKV